MGLVDSHCHLNFSPLNEDIEGVLARAKQHAVDYLLCVAVNIEDFPEVIALAQAYPHIFASVGVHPCYADAKEPTVEELIELAADANVVAIGETGLDYFRFEGDMAWQHQRFAHHIEAAKMAGKPLIVHTREAAQDTMDMLKSEGADQCGGVMHCFAENWEIASQALDLGMYISFSGIVTFNSADTLREVAKKVPLDRMLVETDAPYLAPVPKRGKSNQPAFVSHTAKFIADLRNIDFRQLAEQTTDNFFRLFDYAQRIWKGRL